MKREDIQSLVKEIGYQRKVLDAIEFLKARDQVELDVTIGDREYQYIVTNGEEINPICEKDYQNFSPNRETLGQLKRWPLDYTLPKFNDFIEEKIKSGMKLETSEEKIITNILFSEIHSYYRSEFF